MIKLLIFILLMGSSQALELSERRREIIKIINEEMREVARLNAQRERPVHLLRLAELSLEKGRLYRDKENERYLSLSETQRRKANKARYFTQSTKYFKQASSLASKIAKRYPRYSGIGEVYYILGFNAKELNNSRQAINYFNRAAKGSPNNSKIKIKAQISLAELYFNEKKYKKAARLYESALGRYRDKWWTKDSFNLAWAYYRTNQNAKAIKKMKEVYQASGSDKFVDMRDQVERDIGVMYATSGKVNEGIAFYRKLGKDFVPMLIKIAQTLKSQGKYTDADKVLGIAISRSKKSKDKEEVYLEQLDLFAKYNRYRDHLNASKKLFAIRKSLSDQAKEQLLYHVKKEGARLQKQAASKTYARMRKTRRSKAAMAIDYFEMVAELNPKDKEEYLYLQAETAKLIGNDALAFEKYKEAYEVRSKKFAKQTMDGMLLMLSSKGLKEKFKEDNYVYVYGHFIQNFPEDKRVKLIYQKLFKVFVDKKDYANARKVLDRYAEKFKSDDKTQEAMIGSLVDADKKRNDFQALRLWASQLESGDYNVSKKYKEQLKAIITSAQIDGIQKDLEKGNKKKALIGYLKVIKDPHATEAARVNAKYNIAALYYELKHTELSYKWALSAIKDMGQKDVKKFASSFLTMSNFYFVNLDFEKSTDLSSSLFFKLCYVDSTNKNLAFKNAAFLSLADGRPKTVENLLQNANKCKVYESTLAEVQFELLDYYLDKNMLQEAEELSSAIAKNKKFRGVLISRLYRLYDLNLRNSNTAFAAELKKRIMNYYRYAQKNRYDLEAQDLEVVARFEADELRGIKRQIEGISLSFPEDQFNRELKQMLTLLDRLTNKAIGIQKIGSGVGIVESYHILMNTYRYVIDSINNFRPEGKSNDYVASFSKSMQQLTGPLEGTLNSYKRNAKDSIFKNEILAELNNEVLDQASGNKAEYVPRAVTVIMDRGGDI